LFAVDREKLDNMRVELLRGMKINELFLSCMQRDGVVKHGQKLDIQEVWHLFTNIRVFCVKKVAVLALESRHKGSIAPSLGSPVVDEERTRPDHWWV